MRITVKVDLGSRNRSLKGRWVKRGELLGLSPYFDDQVVLSPISGTIERMEHKSEEGVVLITIRSQNMRWQVAHAQ